jgi:ribose 5-phosphate isomerase B
MSAALIAVVARGWLTVEHRGNVRRESGVRIAKGYSMKIAIGSEHRGYHAKNDLLKHLRSTGYDVEDFGCHHSGEADCVDIAWSVSAAVARGDWQIGILISGSGMGMCMKANKVRGIRAAVAHDEFSARRTREKHHCNVLCLGADLDGSKCLKRIVDHFLATELDSARHPLIVKKLTQIEEMACSPPLAPDELRAGPFIAAGASSTSGWKGDPYASQLPDDSFPGAL